MKTALLVALPALPVLLHAFAALAAGRGDREAAWRRAEAVALAATVAAAAALVAVLMAGPQVYAGLRLDVPGAVVALLVGFVGWVIVCFSRSYLRGEPNERRYLTLLAATLAAVSLVLAADHLLLLAGAWMATSALVHRLLRFYIERPAARLAAHKKFLSARVADAALLGAVALFGIAYGSLSLQVLVERAAVSGVTPLAQLALVLLVITALLKCAQLPMHGWLIQVMEAPTPVSALLHAGVVNLGGLVLIRFAPLLAQAPAALIILGVVAAVTVLVATLVMGTRVSIKLALAWSTVAQMGFMLLQVALGLPAMALLHLVAHSLYKAHAFLSAGGTVRRLQAQRLGPPVAPVAWHWALASMVVPALVLGAGSALGALTTPSLWLAAAVLGVALVPLAASGRGGLAAVIALAWFAAHALAASLISPGTFAVSTLLPAGVALIFALLFALQAAVVLRPDWPAIRALHARAYGGFYIDQFISRALLRQWPLPTHATPAGARS